MVPLNRVLPSRFVLICCSILIVLTIITTPCLSQVTAQKKYQDEIAALLKNPKVKEAFKTIVDLDRETLQNLITLTEIPAPPFHEQARGEKFSAMLRSLGPDSLWTDREGNVIALLRGKNPKRTVLIEGHLDTVFPATVDVSVKERGDTLYAPGIGDNGRGLAIVLTLLKTLRQTNIRTDANVVFAGTVGEEGLGDLRGVKALFNPENKLKIDSYISIDMDGTETIVHGGVGSTRYRITYRGPGGHSFSAFGTVNPHNALARAITRFVALADPYCKEGVPTTYNVGVIGGGSSVNAIPNESWMEVDMRSEDPARLEQLDKFLKEAIDYGLKEENKMKKLGPDLTVEVKRIGSRPAAKQSESLALVQRAIASVAALGFHPVLTPISTNANLPISLGVPAICIGIGGRTANAHSTKEWWINDKGHLAIQNALLIFLAEAGVVK